MHNAFQTCIGAAGPHPVALDFLPYDGDVLRKQAGLFCRHQALLGLHRHTQFRFAAGPQPRFFGLPQAFFLSLAFLFDAGQAVPFFLFPALALGCGLLLSFFIEPQALQPGLFCLVLAALFGLSLATPLLLSALLFHPGYLFALLLSPLYCTLVDQCRLNGQLLQRGRRWRTEQSHAEREQQQSMRNCRHDQPRGILVHERKHRCCWGQEQESGSG
jgi:hypothetical protein